MTPNHRTAPSEIVTAGASTIPVDVEAIARNLGLRVRYEPLGDCSGKIQRGSDGRYDITVNERDPKVRQRFTLAHEIAHYVLHEPMIGDGIVDDAMYRSGLADVYETEANNYAAAILMPAPLVKARYRTQKMIAALAADFGVSEAAMRIRLRSLRIGA
jgi:Zn-dependent peptidase ImmA (M78 family)